MKSGYVYILSNPAYPGLLKIGSTDNVERRVRELSNTSVPEPFVLEFSIASNDCVGDELRIHQKLDGKRPNNRREFFRIDVDDAVDVVMLECKPVLEKDRESELLQGRPRLWGLMSKLRLRF